MVVLFFYLAYKQSKWCTQTLNPFSQIFNFFSAIRTPIVAPPSVNLENCSICLNGLFFRKKSFKPHLNRPTNADAMSCNSTVHRSGRRPKALFLKIYKKKQTKWKTSHFILSRQHASGDFQQILHGDRGSPCHHFRSIRFWVSSIVFPLGVVKNLAINVSCQISPWFCH